MERKEAHDFIDGIIDREDPGELTVSTEVHMAFANGGPAHCPIGYLGVLIYSDGSFEKYEYAT